eukprot:6259088-Amphidinium_carterae.1
MVFVQCFEVRNFWFYVVTWMCTLRSLDTGSQKTVLLLVPFAAYNSVQRGSLLARIAASSCARSNGQKGVVAS